MDDTELRAELERVLGELSEEESIPEPDLQAYLRRMHLHLRAAWLLVADGRYDDAVEAAEAGNRARSAAMAASTGPGYGGAVSWEACEVEAVTWLARGKWRRAEKAARRALQDFDEQVDNYRLLELALQAQGKLHPDRVWKESDDPARDLAEFDARRYALRKLEPGI
ncbi:hypothetical protein DZF91_31715 [Actinomadura logoneensis]|uniref:Tetratricopeptide repeat protein n=1 Tax=Actinomadura logoneensis TaxID=2293572 RepID=A0A372JCV5_9ACTN|nr:hypothetical protein [Actinomadura logoneensis]RFU37664.1 hypothetical protein DZF91_31715 [Actinomadura logoneensis]